MNMNKDEQPTSPPSVKQILAEFQSKLDDDNRFRKPPPIPRKEPPPLPKKPPSHAPSNGSFGRCSSDAEILRRSLGPKPKLAPKPQYLNGMISSNSASEISNHEQKDTPQILVSPFDDQKPSSSNIDMELNSTTDGIRDRAKLFENLGFVPRANLPAKIERPVSEISTASQISDDFDDGDTTASDEESSTVGTSSIQELKELRRLEDGFEELPLPRQERKNTMCTNTHSEIMHEMEEMGFVKSGNKKPLKQRRQSNVDNMDIPSDIGKLRDNRKGRHNSLFVPSTSTTTISSDDYSRITSMTSDRSSTLTTTSGGDMSDSMIPDYVTGDEEEDKRLKKLHYAAVEFQKVQTNYVQYLREMATLYPEYMERFGKRIGRDLLAPHGGHENVVLQIKKVILQILPSHEMLLNEINNVISCWDSQSPCMSRVIFTYADFLKCCQPFLDHKAEFLNHLLALRNENKEFDEATYMFETEVFKRGKKGAVLQQLDQVHQNFMRYKLLMLRYSEYLLDDTEEKKKALETIEKLEKVTQTVNQKMGLPTTEELTKLYYRFQCQFNVLEPGRGLIRQGDVQKQTRKEEQPRYLVLFTDCLWICRISSSRASSGQFEMHRSYRIPLEGMRFEQPEHEDYARYLVIKSKIKSAVVIFPSEKERDQWYDDIQKATYDRKSYRRRQSEAIIKHEENKRKLNKFLEEKQRESQIDEEEEGESIDRPCILSQRTRSRSNSRSCSSDGFSSVPVTPLDSDGCGSSIASTSCAMSQKKQTSEVKPVWLPDNISSECLMEGCSTEFSIINRRHHCRECGWLICKDCKGQAPLSKYEYRKQNVCPECFERFNKLYLNGVLFPSQRLITISDGSYLVRVGRRHESEAIEPRKLFKPPFNYRLRKRNIDEKRESGIVFGKVYYRNRKNIESVRHALLRKQDLKLIFYKAELDKKSSLEVLVHGYVYRETILDGKSGVLFELVHRNQIRTNNAKDDIVAFRVDNTSSAKRWSSAFEEHLCKDPSNEP